MTLDELFWKLIAERFRPSWVYFVRSRKNIYSLLEIVLNSNPWNLTMMLHIRQSIYLVLTNVLSAPHHIWWNQHSTVYTILVKVDELNTCGTIIYSYFMESHFCYFYEDRECCLHILQKTSNEHIKLTPYSKMNVKLPA